MNKFNNISTHIEYNTVGPVQRKVWEVALFLKSSSDNLTLSKLYEDMKFIYDIPLILHWRNWRAPLIRALEKENE